MAPAHPTHSPGEAGFGVVEVLVSATLLVISLLALYSVLDTQTEASGLNRGASTASAVAEGDQERMRGLRVAYLADRTDTRTVDVGGERFTVTSAVEWSYDEAPDALGCGSAKTQAGYLRLQTTVDGERLRTPIIVNSLVAAPLGEFGDRTASANISLKTAAGAALPGAAVTLTGPENVSQPGNAEGCAVFNRIKPGAYTASASLAGHVSPSGSTTATANVSATAGTLNSTDLQYDRSASAVVSFRRGSTSNAANVRVLSAANPKVPACGGAPATCPPAGAGFRLFTPPNATASITASNLFPFSDGYTFYAGSCAANNPALISGYAGTTTRTLAPGSSANLTVRVPPLNLVARKDSGKVGHIVATPTDPGCSDVYRWEVSATSSGGTLTQPIPFGNYSICVDNGTVA